MHDPLEVEAQGLLQPLGVGVLDAGVGAVDVVARENLLVAAQLGREESAGEQLLSAGSTDYLLSALTICCQH